MVVSQNFVMAYLFITRKMSFIKLLKKARADFNAWKPLTLDKNDEFYNHFYRVNRDLSIPYTQIRKGKFEFINKQTVSGKELEYKPAQHVTTIFIDVETYSLSKQAVRKHILDSLSGDKRRQNRETEIENGEII